MGSQSLEWVKSIWTKLQPKIDAQPAALEAAQEAAQMPADEDVRTSFRCQLKKLLEEDKSLAEEVSRLLEQGKATGIIISATGECSVAIGGDVKGSTILTGDRHELP